MRTDRRALTTAAIGELLPLSIVFPPNRAPLMPGLPASPGKRAYGSAETLECFWGQCHAALDCVMLQALEELDDSILFRVLQLLKLLSHMGCLTAVPADCVAKCHRFPIVHQSWTQAHPPQRGSAYFVAAALEVLP